RSPPAPSLPFLFQSLGRDSEPFKLLLTESALTIQRISSSPGRTKVVFNLTDCIGCRAYRGPDGADVGAYFTAYFYPFKRRWMSAGVTRQRVEQCFRVALVQDPLQNLQEAERWAHAIRDASVLQDGAEIQPHILMNQQFVRRPCRTMILVNPHSGRGQALQLFTGHIQGMLTEASVPYKLVLTEHQNHARELVKKADLSQWDALVIMSGDGLLFEVINGLMDREDWQEAIQTPLGILPGGSGNALAAIQKGASNQTSHPPRLSTPRSAPPFPAGSSPTPLRTRALVTTATARTPTITRSPTPPTTPSPPRDLRRRATAKPEPLWTLCFLAWTSQSQRAGQWSRRRTLSWCWLFTSRTWPRTCGLSPVRWQTMG
uniref:sphingosine kinase n=1 Tax=Stegastes partitus TaxID=144197 RepID=A0A3B5AP70_9TELE